ncbi:MAG: hypothetical protein MUE70_00880 [Desulfobacterales bacterium]|jgi:hypothetical protein|nr:hypothetical protein [Desulfobacterales bacterium]
MDEILRASLFLKAVLPLMEDLVDFDTIAASAISDKRLILQFEVKNGPSSHLRIEGGKIRHGIGMHQSPDIRLTFKKPELLNRMFDGEDVRPGLRKGFFHLLFLIREFPKLAERLQYYLEGDGKKAVDEKTKNFQVRIGLHAMLGGMATVASDDASLRSIADETPFGTLLVRILPDGPFGTFTKLSHNGGYIFESTFNQPVRHANAVMEFAGPDAAKKLIDGALNAVTAIGLGQEIKIRGLLPLIDKASIFLYRFGKIMGV